MIESYFPEPTRFTYHQDRSDIGWHALRGYDFAGLEGMLRTGIEPAEERIHDRGVSLSYNLYPGFQPLSLLQYTLRPGLSVRVDLNGNGDRVGKDNQHKETEYRPVVHGYHGFEDEVRYERVAPNTITGIMLPLDDIGKPLALVETTHEPRSVNQFSRYINRAVLHIVNLGGDVPNINVDEIMAGYVNGDTDVKRAIARNVEGKLMRAYSSVAAQLIDVTEPTVKDMLDIVQTRSESNREILIFDDEVVQRVRMRIQDNAVWRARKNAANMLALQSGGSFHPKVL